MGQRSTSVCLPLWVGIRVLQTGWLSVSQDRALCLCVVCVSVGVRVSVKQWLSVSASLCVPVCLGECGSVFLYVAVPSVSV